MSHSPHRYRGDAAECWRTVLFGEIVRAVNRPTAVAPQETIKLPRSGRWESGLGRITPALDDALGATAFAVAWRWACAEKSANAWPGLPLVARFATDLPSSLGTGAELARIEAPEPIRITTLPGHRSWTLGTDVTISIDRPIDADWTEVDRIADILSAWLALPWTVTTRPE